VVTPTTVPLEQSVSHVAASTPVAWDWGGFLRTVILVIVLGVALAWVLTRRTVARWGAAEPDQAEEDGHA
jgi:hypothetical protein